MMASKSMKLYAAGFNAWNQLLFSPDSRNVEGHEDNEPDDLYNFQLVLEGNGIDPPVSRLSYTLVWADSQMRKAGSGIPNTEQTLHLASKGSETTSGEVLVVQVHDDDPPQHSILKYPSSDAHEDQIATQCWPSPKLVRQIAAFDTGWVILYQDGTIATLGDARFEPCLGREVTEDQPADQPNDVPEINNLGEPIRKVAAGGYTVIALTDSGSLYAWGLQSAGTHRRQQAIPGLTDMPNYVEVDGGKDVQDIALGESHAVALTADGDIYVIGGNENGQLGIGKDFAGRTREWMRVKLDKPKGHHVIHVVAGPRSSFVLTTNEPASS